MRLEKMLNTVNLDKWPDPEQSGQALCNLVFDKEAREEAPALTPVQTTVSEIPDEDRTSSESFGGWRKRASCARSD